MRYGMENDSGCLHIEACKVSRCEVWAPIAANRKGFRLKVCVPVQKGVHAERVGKQAHDDITLKIVDMVVHSRIMK